MRLDQARPRAAPLRGATVLLRAVAAALWRCYERRRQRLLLAGLDDRALRDLGLTRAAVDRECAKSFWQA